MKLWNVRSSIWTLIATVLLSVGLGALICLAVASNWKTASPEDRLTFDPTAVSLVGVNLAEVALGVLGCLLVTNEWSTGMIRATWAAVPKRSNVLVAKVLVFILVAGVVAEIASFGAFFAGQAVLSSQHIQTSLGSPHVLRAVAGSGLYLVGVGLLGMGLGLIFRHTAGSISTLLGLLLVVPIIGIFLPSAWGKDVRKILPSNAGHSILTVRMDPDFLKPWTGIGVFFLYVIVFLVVGWLIALRRDA